LTKNPILHSRDKQNEIKHPFIRDYVHKGIIDLMFVLTDDQLLDIFTKPYSGERFNHLRVLLSMNLINE